MIQITGRGGFGIKGCWFSIDSTDASVWHYEFWRYEEVMTIGACNPVEFESLFVNFVHEMHDLYEAAR